MIPAKAIEILSLDLTYTYPARFDDLQDATNLGKEALERLIAMRPPGDYTLITLLPSETKV